MQNVAKDRIFIHTDVTHKADQSCIHKNNAHATTPIFKLLKFKVSVSVHSTIELLMQLTFILDQQKVLTKRLESFDCQNITFPFNSFLLIAAIATIDNGEYHNSDNSVARHLKICQICLALFTTT